MLEKLRKKCVELLPTNEEKYTVINYLLKDDNCFMKMDINTAFSILSDLEVEDIPNTYIELVKKK